MLFNALIQKILSRGSKDEVDTTDPEQESTMIAVSSLGDVARLQRAYDEHIFRMLYMGDFHDPVETTVAPDRQPIELRLDESTLDAMRVARDEIRRAWEDAIENGLPQMPSLIDVEQWRGLTQYPGYYRLSYGFCTPSRHGITGLYGSEEWRKTYSPYVYPTVE